MTADPPKYRPLERFWPYAELPEQPTAAELAALDPDLYEALFGAQKRPFSITLVFPALDIPAFAAALELARAAVAGFEIEGPKTNLPFFAELLGNEEFISGRYDTGLIDRMRAPAPKPAP